MISFSRKIINFLKNRSGSPLVEETILIGIALFTLTTVIIIIFNLIDMTDDIFQQFGDGLW